MPNEITDGQIVNQMIRYFILARTMPKSLLKTGNIPQAHYHILSILEERGQMRMGEIAEMLSISRPNLTLMVDQLMKLNYVERNTHGHDRRVICIVLTDVGHEILKKENDIIIKGISSFTSKLTDDDYEHFTNSLDFITEMFLRLE